MSRNQSAISNAKSTAAARFMDYRTGTGSLSDYLAADAKVAGLTGESPQSSKASAGSVSIQSALSYFPSFVQINGWYCGPATAQNILWWKGPHTSHDVDPNYGTQVTLNSDPYHDQPILADSKWLVTSQQYGTGWGSLYMPYTLNYHWRGIDWYIEDSRPGWEGSGNLTQSKAWSDIVYDIGSYWQYPIAENIKYDSSSYYPNGFAPGYQYLHWDTIYGYGDSWVWIAQSYASPGYGRYSYQAPYWPTHWTAIQNWAGLVW